MATEDVKILKEAGIIAVRHANGNLRIPGFKVLENCDTTVDMDRDPEVFMMLEPVLIVPHLNKAIPNSDMRTSAQRLRTIFKAATVFFEFRLPNGEKVLRQNGIGNLPSEVFDNIKAALVKSDRRFWRFSTMAIKRCLQLFTENVLDDAGTVLTTGKGDTTARDAAREAWEAVKHFRAMLTQDWSTIRRANNPVTARPRTGSNRNAQQTLFTSHAHRSNSSSFFGTETQGESSSAARVANAPATTAGAYGDAHDCATTSQDDVPLPSPGPPQHPIPDDSAVIQRRTGITSDFNELEIIDLTGDYSPNRATASPTVFETRRSSGSGQSAPSALGKHKRAEPDLDETLESRPATICKHQHKSRTPWNDIESFHINDKVDVDKAYKEQYADRYHHMNASDQHIVREVLTLRDRVRHFEKEKEEALAEQRQQLRPGLVTMKMTPRVQQRVNRLFPPTGNAPAEHPRKQRPGLVTMKLSSRVQRKVNQLFPPSTSNGSRSKPARYSNSDPVPRSIRKGGETIEEWMEGVDEATRRRGVELMPAPVPFEDQDGKGKGKEPHLPPIGYFQHPLEARKEPETPKPKASKLTRSKTSPNQTTTARRRSTRLRKSVRDDDGDESYKPTESSWASSIPE